MPKSTSHKRLKLAVDNGAGRMRSDQHYTVMLSLIGICEGGPVDLADRHDHYLHQQFDSEYKLAVLAD